MSTLRLLVLSALIAVVALGGCGKKFPDDSKVLATVNGENITEKEFENYIQLLASQQRPVPGSDKEKKVVLDELIDRVVIAQHGTALGYEQNPEIYFRLKRARENLLVQEVVRNTLKDVQFSDDDVKKRLSDELEKAHKTEYQVRHILVSAEEDAKSIAEQLKAGKKFDQLARDKSLDKDSAKRGGALGEWINQGSPLVPEFMNAVMTLKKGETSAPVKSDFGWHIIRVDDTRPFKLPTLEQLTSNPSSLAGIRRRMQDEKLQASIKELKEKAKIEIK